MAIGGNIGNGSYMYYVQANTHAQAQQWQDANFLIAARPPSHCTDTGRFTIITTCSDKVAAQFKAPASGMTNAIQTPPLHNPQCYEEWKDNKPSLYEMMNVLSAARSTFGTPYTAQAFGHGDKLFVEFILQRHTHFKRMVEFGTWTGVTSMFFGLAAALRRGSLTTFDIADQRSTAVLSVWLHAMSFQLADLEDATHINAKVVRAVERADLLFNDGWHKNVEAELYADSLPVGAGYLEHDFSYDHGRRQEGYFLQALGFEARYEDVAVHMNSCARFWIRTSLGSSSKGSGGGGVKESEEEEGPAVEVREKEADIRFVQWAMQFEEGRELLARFRKEQKGGA